MSSHAKNSKSILITESDSGVGLEVVKSLANQAQGLQNVVIILAAAKNPNNSELNNITRHNPKVKTVQLDLEDFKNFGNFANEVQKKLNEAGVQHLSALINCTSLNFNSNLKNIDAAQMIKAFSVNAVSPLMLIKALSKQLQNGVQVSGVTTGNGATKLIYSASKAASAVQRAIQEAGGAANVANAGQKNAGNITELNRASNNAPMTGPLDATSTNNQELYSYQQKSRAKLWPQSRAKKKKTMTIIKVKNDYKNQDENFDNNQGKNYSSYQRQHSGLGENNTIAHFGLGGHNSGAILVGAPGQAFTGMGAGALVVNLTSGLSSISANNNGQFYAYRSSKSALNMITKTAAADLVSTGVLVYSLNIDNAALDSKNQKSGINNIKRSNAQGF
ncbi:unnamed protein product [Lepeophtheirus salmonis]|uniref:(salmon louse) hypothetical protein n=1 Tax=Lepeophtheirus salmonis TaxID=72036 RepID=A0A7R8CSI0_LEPSM|nr:unnamed protein product [Lepeophtheirus salmonis]CAF2917138.1 unnamed protein product [Lepeophtheirus salmonis]